MSPTYEGRRYDDMLQLIHHSSATHPRMSMHDRAAQFAPFAALTGYEAVIEETGRLTDSRIELDEGGKALLDEKLRMLHDTIKSQPRIIATVFRPDERKSGGAYVRIMGYPKRIDICEKMILLLDGTVIPIEDLYDIEADYRA